MQRTRPLFFLPVVFFLLLTACASSPEDKVRQAEERNKALQESSGYNECMRLVKIDEQKIKDCYKTKLAAAGYTDGFECVGTGLADTEPVCKSTARYNAEVAAHNECPNEVQFETELGEGDCNKMLMDVMAQ